MIKLTLISFQSLPHAESSKERQVGSYKQTRMIFNKYYMHEIDRHLQILSSGCNRHMYVPVLKFDYNVSQTYMNAQIHACTCTHTYSIGTHERFLSSPSDCL